MPDHLKDEETETRTRSLCLYNVLGITRTSNRRCDNCPGAARAPLYHQQRCPLDRPLEYNLFIPAGAAAENWKSEVDSKFLASSSKTLSHGEDTVATKNANSSLNAGSTGWKRLYRPSRSDPGFCNSNSSDRSVSIPHFEIGVKRKADHQSESSMRTDTEEVQNAESNKLGAVSPVEGYSDTGAEWMQNKHLKFSQEPLVEDLANSFAICSVSSPVHMQEEPHAEGDMSSDVNIVIELEAAEILNRPENSLRTELAAVSSPNASVHTGGNERVIVFRDGSSDVEEYIRNKQQNIFQDLQRDEPLFLERSLTDTPASWSSLMNFLDDIPNDMQEDHTLGKASSSGICVPGFGVMAETQGVRTCYDGIFNVNGPEKSDLMAMADLTDEPSIDQMEEAGVTEMNICASRVRGGIAKGQAKDRVGNLASSFE